MWDRRGLAMSSSNSIHVNWADRRVPECLKLLFRPGLKR